MLDSNDEQLNITVQWHENATALRLGKCLYLGSKQFSVLFWPE